MRFISLFSSSKGNLYLLEKEGELIAIDFGVSFKHAKKSFAEANLSLESLKKVFITHEHGDHIRGLKELNIKYNIPIHSNQQTIRKINEKDHRIENFEITDGNHDYENYSVEVVKLSHDVIAPQGYIFRAEDIKISFILDTGFLTEENLKQVDGSDLLIIESNYDDEKLIASDRPLFLKSRIMGDQGHLSNKATKSYLDEISCKHVVLAHISEEVNSEEEILKLYDGEKVSILKPREKVEIEL